MAIFSEIEILNNLNLEHLSDFTSIFCDLNEKFGKFIGIKSLYSFNNVQVSIEDISSKYASFFNFGVEELRPNEFLYIKINHYSLKFVPFILFREILNSYVPKKFRKNNSVNLIINQILMLIFSEFSAINEWRLLVRGELERQSLKSKWIKLLTDFDRLERFFYYLEFKGAPNPIQYFFNYIINKQNLISNYQQSFMYIFFKGFEEKLFILMIDNDLVETLRVIIKIFYELKHYRNLLEYKKEFQNLKKRGVLKTNLSQRSFSEKMDWIKLNSYISPSYQINFNAISMGLVIINISFNPIIKINQINKILSNFPFAITPKMSFNKFSHNIIIYVVFPIKYLNDLMKILEKFSNNNYIIRYFAFLRIGQQHCINLNYFKKEFNDLIFINPNRKSYQKNLEICFHSSTETKFYKQDLKILDFLILDRIRWFSEHSLGFESRAENLKIIKSDLLNEISHQQSTIVELKELIKFIYKSDKIKEDLIVILLKSIDFGFFNLKIKLENMIQIINAINNVNKMGVLKDADDLRDYIIEKRYSHLLEHNLNFKKIFDHSTELYQLVNLHFKSKNEYAYKTKLYKICLKLLKICNELKIYDLDVIRKIVFDENLPQILFHSKEKKLQEIYNEYQIQDITSKLINSTLETLIELDPPVISPLLINTIITKNFEKDYIQMILIDLDNIESSLSKIQLYFPRFLIYRIKDLISDNSFLYVEISTPPLTSKELKLFVSILYNIFKDKLIYLNNHVWSGFVTRFSTKDFYDFENKEFFYTKDLYEQYFNYVRSILSDKYDEIHPKNYEKHDLFWLKSNKMQELVEIVNSRRSLENNQFEFKALSKLKWFNSSLESFIMETNQFLKIKTQFFFQNFIKAIKFLPAFHKFGFSQVIYYFVFNDMNNVDFNSVTSLPFRKIKYPACIDDTIPILLFCLFPIRESKNLLKNQFYDLSENLREYCGFSIKKTHIIFQFDLNIAPTGWDYDSLEFKEHVERVLFDNQYIIPIQESKTFDFSSHSIKELYGVDSQEFHNLCKIFTYKSIDIKSYIGTKKVKTVERIQSLLKKGLIFPFIGLKNVNLIESIYIIIPNLTAETSEILINIFRWFNYGFIHEIEGIYFISGFQEPIEFSRGLMIKIYFPKCEITEFKTLFDMTFEYLEIEHYLILKDFVNGDTLIKNIYEDPNFFDNYHPLRNVKNNGKDDNK